MTGRRFDLGGKGLGNVVICYARNGSSMAVVPNSRELVVCQQCHRSHIIVSDIKSSTLLSLAQAWLFPQTNIIPS